MPTLKKKPKPYGNSKGIQIKDINLILSECMSDNMVNA